MADRHLIDVHLLLLRPGPDPAPGSGSGSEVLLSLRRDPAHPRFDNRWHLPSGKLDAGESALTAAAREAHEELGVTIAEADLRLVHTAHATAPGVEPRLGLFFVVAAWGGEPVNAEPDKCAELRWFGLDALPDDLIEYSLLGLDGHRTATPFSVYGW
ncbi:NUDIX domain-containing protein [Actinosynnema pretiosum subsp. pretiosum]|uniref:NUDIX domain-containing protein n=1 Tax=Actinosynnema pretiosum subsp. pretiosum TaxID=103721 RepID=A0AA45LBC7_9PSEU|nr:putative MutT family protein [Actinosynnema pretiosum subsp. pretiosum]QUF06175.1 NUDIX domain-containing protein [Actinosynnema pretiosum subsp. pretiosum]